MKRILLLAVASVLFAQTAEYRDPAGRFRFTHPPAWGAVERGTNDGFGGRVAAVRFADPRMEVVLTRGAPQIALQAAGGLYDSIALEIMPDARRVKLEAGLPRLTAATLCAAIGREEPPVIAGFELELLRAVQRQRHVAPKVIRCQVLGDLVVFDKEVAPAPGSPRHRVFGAVRFLAGAYSTFQIVAYGPDAPGARLDEFEAAARSFSAE